MCISYISDSLIFIRKHNLFWASSWPPSVASILRENSSERGRGDQAAKFFFHEQSHLHDIMPTKSAKKNKVCLEYNNAPVSLNNRTNIR